MHDTRRVLSAKLLASSVALFLTSCSSPGPTPTPIPQPGPAPQLTCPAEISQTTPTGGPTAVIYQAPVAVNGTPPVTTSCSPASGAQFPVGATLVTCTATDSAARVGSCGFTVRVTLAPKLQKTWFMAFGDSMTAGVLALRAPLFTLTPSAGSYPADLSALLTQRYVSQTIVVDDEGVPGEETAEGLDRLEGLLRKSSPEVVLLLQGANDLNAGGEAAAADAAWAMEHMVVAAKDAGAVPFLATIPPQREGGYRVYHPEAVLPYNQRLVSVAAFRGATLVDVYAAFGGTASTDLIGPDGLHPTEAGYQRIAETFFAAIKAKLEVPQAGLAARAVRK